jgi:hypothetical protein
MDPERSRWDAGGDWKAGEDRAFTVDEVVAEVFGADRPTLAQRGSILRAAHRVIARADAKNKYPLREWRASPLSGRRIVFHHKRFRTRWAFSRIASRRQCVLLKGIVDGCPFPAFEGFGVVVRQIQSGTATNPKECPRLSARA